jgi:hypothetical protein
LPVSASPWAQPLPNAEDIRQLAQRLERVESRLQETNDKLDKVLTALGSKEPPTPGAQAGTAMLFVQP